MGKDIVITITVRALVVALIITANAAPSVFAQTRRGAQEKPTAVAATAVGDYYTCVMHPEVREKKAGRCPKCKMELRLHHAEPQPAAPQAAAPAPSQPAATKYEARAMSSKMSIPDVELVDQNGRKVHFYSDLVKGRTVAINFIFTTCTTICPPLGATFRRVEQQLGERAGRDVQLISISVDPVTDTPERLKAWGAKFHAGAGWTLVTGAKPAVDELLRALGAQTARPEDHSPSVLVGNDARSQWTRTYGLASPTQLVRIVEEALAGRLDAASANQPPQQ